MLIIDEDRVTFYIENTRQIYKGEIIFNLLQGYFIGRVRALINGHFTPRDNDTFLVDSGFNKREQQKLYEEEFGYWEPGSGNRGWWPWCRTRENLIRILHILDEKTKDTEFIDISVII